MSTDSLKPFLLITQDLNEIRKITKTLVGIVKQEMFAKFLQKNVKLGGGWSS